MSNYSGRLVPVLSCCCMVCVNRFVVIKDESVHEMVECARSISSLKYSLGSALVQATIYELLAFTVYISNEALLQ